MEQTILDDQFTSDFARLFNAALTSLIWIVLGVGVFYGIALLWTHQWILAVLGILSVSIVPIAGYAKHRIQHGHIRTSLGIFTSAILLILGSALLLVHGLDAAIIAGMSIPMVVITLMRIPRFSVGIAVCAGLLSGVPLLAPVLPWQPITLSPMVGSILTLVITLATFSILGLVSWQIVSMLQRAMERAHMHLAAHQSAAAELVESEARFRSAFDYAAIGMALVSPEGRWLQVNQAACNLVGYSESELLTTTFQAIMHPDDLDIDAAYVEQMLSGAIRTYQITKRYLHKTGRIVWVLLSVSLVRDVQERPRYFIAQIQDITAHKQAVSELAQSYANNYALLEALPDTLYRLGADGTLRDYKAGYVDDLASPSALFRGRHVTDFFPPIIAEQVERAIMHVLTTGRLQLMEQQVVVNTVPRDYELRVVSSGVDEVLALVRDITERKTSERLKDEFVGVVSHELRTPLTAIRGALGLLVGGVAGALPAQAQAMADIALANSERLIRLINDLLDIQKIEAGQLTMHRTPLALLPLLEQIITSNAAYGQQFDVTFRLEDVSDTVVVNTDADRFAQVLTNLLSNAAKFSPHGDTVVIRVSQHQQRVRIAVIDHGPGIPEAFRNQLFQKFAQADGSNTRRTGGTGLGLSIAKALIERLGGHIGFETTASVGTTFYVDLPKWHDEVVSCAVA